MERNWLQAARVDAARPRAFLNAFLGTFSVTRPLFPDDFPGDTTMAVSKPVGDNARKGAVRKRSQLKTDVEDEAL
jgi:hypothetical protein